VVNGAVVTPLKTAGILPSAVVAVAAPLNLLKAYW
jgi:hypothetical protein